MKTTELRTDTVEALHKAQFVRLIDVFAIAPACIWAGAICWKAGNKPISVAMYVIGISTFYYNARNYLLNMKLESKRNANQMAEMQRFFHAINKNPKLVTDYVEPEPEGENE